MDNEHIRIESDGSIVSEEEIKLHFTCNEELTLKELSDIFDLTNKAINDFNRENGVSSNAQIGQKYATKVTKVEHGSIVIYIVANLIVPVALSVLANYIYERIKELGVKKKKDQKEQVLGYPINLSVNGNDNLIEIHVHKLGTSNEGE